MAKLEVDPAFTKVTAGSIVTNLATSWGAAWGDFDNDGFIDLVVSNSGGEPTPRRRSISASPTRFKHVP